MNKFDISFLPLSSLSFGTCFKAKRKSDGFEGCLKISPPIEESKQRQLQQSFEHLMRIEYKYIHRYLEFFWDNNRFCIFSAFAPNGSLKDRISKPNSEENIIKWTFQILEGVSCLERNGVKVDYIKPEDVLFFGENELKLDPFSFSKYFEIVTFPKSSPYLPPEYFSGQSHSLVWNFGVLMFLLSSGQFPYSTSAKDFNTFINNENPKSIPEGFSQTFCAQISGMIKKIAKERPSLNQVLETLFSNITNKEIQSLSISSSDSSFDLSNEQMFLQCFPHWIISTLDADHSSMEITTEPSKTLLVLIPSQMTNILNSSPVYFKNVESVIIKHSFKTLSDDVFYSSSLKSIDLSDTITQIGNQCFRECSSLNSIHLSDNIIHLGNNCFWQCSSLESIKLPSSLQSLGSYCFWQCSSLNSLDIPENVKTINSDCFRECSSLESIKLPQSVSFSGNYFFYGCTKLSSIDLPQSLTILESYFFYQCSSLRSIALPHSLTKIGDHCFYGCSSLSCIHFSLSITEIELSSFENCSSLLTIHLSPLLTSLPSRCFAGCIKLSSIFIPKSITSIDKTCFFGCENLYQPTFLSDSTGFDIEEGSKFSLEDFQQFKLNQ